jgi:hypothetical protein
MTLAMMMDRTAETGQYCGSTPGTGQLGQRDTIPRTAGTATTGQLGPDNWDNTAREDC